MKLIRALIMTLLGIITMPAMTMAGTESGFYLGAGVGRAGIGDFDPDNTGKINFDANDTGWKVFGGYNFGWIPFLDIAVEGGYVDFGKPDDNVNNTNVKVDADGLDLFALVGVNLGPIGVFGKAGAVNWDAKLSGGDESYSDDGTDPAYGIGARFKLGSLEIRAEYEYFDVDNVDDVSLISASGVWTF